MPAYIALLRGINVSGQKSIKMADLRHHLSLAGFEKVSTYIQSGNLIFKSKEINKKALALKIENTIQTCFGYEVPTLILTGQDLDYILSHNPFLDRLGTDRNRCYVTFLFTPPDPELIRQLQDYHFPSEEYRLDGQTLYFYSPDGYGKAKMNNNFFEQKLKVAATTRNWKTTQILSDMLKEADNV